MSIISRLDKINVNGKLKLDNIQTSYVSYTSSFWDSGSQTAFDISKVPNNNNYLYAIEDSSAITMIRFKRRCLFSVSWEFEQSNAAFYYAYFRDKNYTNKFTYRNTMPSPNYTQKMYMTYLAEAGESAYYSGGIAPAAARQGSFFAMAIEFL